MSYIVLRCFILREGMFADFPTRASNNITQNALTHTASQTTPGFKSSARRKKKKKEKKKKKNLLEDSFKPSSTRAGKAKRGSPELTQCKPKLPDIFGLRRLG